MDTTRNETHYDLGAVEQYIKDWRVPCGRRVTELRVARGMSTQQLADRVGCNNTTIWRIEEAKIPAAEHMKLTIAAVLGVEVEELWPMPRTAEVADRTRSEVAA
jgi:transcriptional regulator with XRE-family HTH domain